MSRECAPQCSYETQSTLNLLPYMDNGKSAKEANKWTFEVAWEVANNVGGIYSVIKSKAYVSTQEMGGNYCLLGPYKENSARNELEETEFAANSPLTAAVHVMRSQGYKLHTGTWSVEGNPQLILFEIESAAHQIDLYKQELRKACNLAVPHLDIEVNDAIVLGFMVARFIAEFRKVLETYSSVPPRVVGHFHEWQAGVGLIMLRTWRVDVATVFTTHGTLLGRHMSEYDRNSYYNLDKVSVCDEANKRGIFHRYNMERTATLSAHIFTTVSEIIGYEAEKLLDRRPDVITPKGLNNNEFRVSHDFQNLHALAKEKINDFIKTHFYGHLNFNLEKTLYFFIAGRYEFYNKGLDVFIESLARLNSHLQSSGSDTTVIAFLIFPAKTNGFNVETLNGQAVAKSIRHTIQGIQEKVANRMYDTCLSGNVPKASDLLYNEDKDRMKGCVYSLQRDGLPPVTTHNVVDDFRDPILNALRHCQLNNASQDRVKVIFHPAFMESTNPLFNMHFKEFVRGCHLGVFPSFYEPWGYTPAECTVMGIPSITTNFSGFGCFMQKHVADPTSHGIYVLDRRHVSLDESILQLAQFMLDFTKLSRHQRIVQRNRTESLSNLLDWNKLGIFYRQARAMALESVYKANVEPESEVQLHYPVPTSAALDQTLLSTSLSPIASSTSVIVPPTSTLPEQTPLLASTPIPSSGSSSTPTFPSLSLTHSPFSFTINDASDDDTEMKFARLCDSHSSAQLDRGSGWGNTL